MHRSLGARTLILIKLMHFCIVFKNVFDCTFIPRFWLSMNEMLLFLGVGWKKLTLYLQIYMGRGAFATQKMNELKN
jgi:hypothetical protein